ncbi:MAG: GTP 3',8-cyclase MoaA [Chitinophagaceae bacterium]|nr:GTP 3',8-cyclase MoaA [Chitinophagaceae bacterium]
MLTDKFNRTHTYLRISITDKCNLRCTYCNPIDLPKGYFSVSNKMSPDEIEQIASTFVKNGITKIRLTGGEPLVRKDAKEIILRLAKLNVELAITTNGVYVNEFIEVFKQANIKTVNVSLDTLKHQKNLLITGRNEFDNVHENINLLLQNDFTVKVNVVVMKNTNDNEILDFVEWTKNQPVHVRFIEFMPFSGNNWSNDKVFNYKEILQLIKTKYKYENLQQDKSDTAMKFKAVNHKGTFAIISTMSKPFCGGCNRLRLTTDGKMKNCLFSKTEVDILTALRNKENIEPLIQQCVWDKEEIQGGQFNSINGINDALAIKNRSMIFIGG